MGSLQKEYEDKILDAITILLNKAIERLNFNRIIEGIVVSSLSSSLYKIKYNDEEYTAKVLDGKTYQANDVVDILIRNNNFSEKIILWKVR